MKNFPFILIIIFSILFVSCGKSSKDTSDKKSTTEEKKTEPKVTEKVNPEDFFKAVKDKDAAKVKDYLAKDPTLVKATTSDFLKETALAIAAFDGYKDIVELLLKNNADPNVYDDMGVAPIHGAARTNRHEIIEMLLNNKANINILHKTSGESPLHYAAEYNTKEACELLLKKGADKTIKDNSGQTAYEVAKEKKSDKVIDLLK
jgi:uncharacterized protein